MALGAHFSAVWIVVANSWMQTPAGYHLESRVDGIPTRLPVGHVVTTQDLGSERAVVDDFWAMVFNPSSIERLTHVVLGAWMAGAFLVVSISAYYLLRRRHYDFAKASLKVGLAFGMVATVLQMISGDISAKGVVKNQPVKLAAMEGLYETTAFALLTAFGWVDPKTQETVGLKIPGLLSFLSWADPEKPVQGLNQLPPDESLRKRYPDASNAELAKIRQSYWPNVPAVFQVFHIMIIVGCLMLAIVIVAGLFWIRGVRFFVLICH